MWRPESGQTATGPASLPDSHTPPVPRKACPGRRPVQGYARITPSCSPPPALSSLLLLSPSSGTFNPSFDGQPRKDFFHILNLLAPANHLNLPPSWASNRRLLKDTGCFFYSQQGASGGSKSLEIRPLCSGGWRKPGCRHLGIAPAAARCLEPLVCPHQS